MDSVFPKDTITSIDEWIYQEFKCPKPSFFFEKKIVIYGAGKVGKDFYGQLSRYENIKIVAWVDKNSEKYFYPYCTIKSVDMLCSLTYDFILVAVLKESLQKTITAELISKGIPKGKIVWFEPKRRSSELSATPVNCNIIKIMGGLGNQMFQYALYLAFKNRNATIKANIGSFKGYIREFELQKAFPNVVFDCDTENVFDAYKNTSCGHYLIKEKADAVFDPSVFCHTDASFIGYWQTEKYFVDIKDEVRKVFQFNLTNKTLKNFAIKLQSLKDTVSIHIRRGDYLDIPDMYCGICTLEYYRRAMTEIERLIGDVPQYVFFSDDLSWVKENFRLKNAIYVSSEMFSDYENWFDMYLMTCCKHNIIANSSFSWWGAWLNQNPQNIVIAPNKWINNKPCTDIWCDGWVRI